MKILNEAGLAYLWQKIKSFVQNKISNDTDIDDKINNTYSAALIEDLLTDKISVGDNISDLNNDAGYKTESEIRTIVEDVIGTALEGSY